MVGQPSTFTVVSSLPSSSEADHSRGGKEAGMIIECLVHEWHHGCRSASWTALEILSAVAVVRRPGILASFPRGRWKSNKGMPERNSTQARTDNCAHLNRGWCWLHRVVWTWTDTCQIAYQRHRLFVAVKCSRGQLISDPTDVISSVASLMFGNHDHLCSVCTQFHDLWSNLWRSGWPEKLAHTWVSGKCVEMQDI